MIKRYSVIFITIVFFLSIGLFVIALVLRLQTPRVSTAQNSHIISPTVTTKHQTNTFTYSVPQIANKPVYRIAMIGDSMTAALGPHGGGLSEYMNQLYKNKPNDPQRIIIDNYAKSSNILAVNEELTKKAKISEYTFGPLLAEDYDLILVESYGYNPLSQFGITGGLQQQNRALDMLMKTLTSTHPHMAIVFVATISPNKENFGKQTQPNMSQDSRTNLADERITYIKNHITYAQSHKIPLINIYEKSLTSNGDGDMQYINPTDNIHPSFAGVDFIDHQIGDYIYNNKILLK